MKEVVQRLIRLFNTNRMLFGMTMQFGAVSLFFVRFFMLLSVNGNTTFEADDPFLIATMVIFPIGYYFYVNEVAGVVVDAARAFIERPKA